MVSPGCQPSWERQRVGGGTWGAARVLQGGSAGLAPLPCILDLPLQRKDLHRA